MRKPFLVITNSEIEKNHVVLVPTNQKPSKPRAEYLRPIEICWFIQHEEILRNYDIDIN